MANIITLVGVGTDDGKTPPQKTQELVNNCQLLIGIQKLTDLFPDAQGEKSLLPHYLDDLVRFLKKNTDKKTVILASTDSNLFGISKYLLRRFSRNDLRIIPHPYSMELAFSAIKESMEGAVITSAHDMDPPDLVKLVHEKEKVGIFTNPSMPADEIIQLLIDDGLKDYTVFLCMDINTRRQRVQEIPLETLNRRRFSPLCILILIKKPPTKILKIAPPALSFLIQDDQIAHREGMLIPSEVRAIILSKLQIQPGLLLWDVGGGSGAFSVEASRFVNLKEVYVIERDLVQARHLYENIHRFHAESITVIEGEIPDVLGDIPDPDRILVGGWDSSINRQIKPVFERLKPGGIMVIHTTSLDVLAEAKRFLKENSFDEEDMSILISSKRRGMNEPQITHHPSYLLVSRKEPLRG